MKPLTLVSDRKTNVFNKGKEQFNSLLLKFTNMIGYCRKTYETLSSVPILLQIISLIQITIYIDMMFCDVFINQTMSVLYFDSILTLQLKSLSFFFKKYNFLSFYFQLLSLTKVRVRVQSEREKEKRKLSQAPTVLRVLVQ